MLNSISQDLVVSTKIDTSPVSVRRALTADEIQRLLAHCGSARRLLYQVALTTGLRANELRHITPAHLDTDQCAIRLEANWTKNRRSGMQPVPEWLMGELVATARMIDHNERLLAITKNHAARFFDKDLEVAGIPKELPNEGKLDFHALRTTFATLLDETGSSAKEAQELCRHSSPVLTMSRYTKTRHGRVRNVVEGVGELVKSKALPQQCPNDNKPDLRVIDKGLFIIKGGI